MNKNQDFWRKLPIKFFLKSRGQISPKLHSESLDRLTYAMRRCVHPPTYDEVDELVLSLLNVTIVVMKQFQ